MLTSLVQTLGVTWSKDKEHLSTVPPSTGTPREQKGRGPRPAHSRAHA